MLTSGGARSTSRAPTCSGLVGEEPVEELSVRRAEVEQTNSSVILGERLILKAYRRLQKGVTPTSRSDAT